MFTLLHFFVCFHTHPQILCKHFFKGYFTEIHEQYYWSLIYITIIVLCLKQNDNIVLFKILIFNVFLLLFWLLITHVCLIIIWSDTLWCGFDSRYESVPWQLLLLQFSWNIAKPYFVQSVSNCIKKVVTVISTLVCF